MTVVPANCPICGSPCAAQEPVCDNCGFVFASRSPGAPPAAAIYSFAQLQPGQSLAQGHYTVQRALSKGGMGAIYLATDHQTFDRIVVVKAMLDYFDPTDPQAVQAAHDRFIQEARTLATLRHPAIPQIYTYFQDGLRNYIVMEYIEGHDLLQRLTHAHDTTGWAIPGKPYAREDVLRWGVALCRVLEYLASRRPEPVVHHDIKPANLLLDSNSGDIRLVDFGTARARLLAQSGRVGLAQSSIYGTQGYAAPEQYSGRSEARSDVYAVAATLYHLATDDDPREHAFEFPRLNELGGLGQALSRALDPFPGNRPAAMELRRDLEELLAPGAPQPIQTPDGLEVYDQAELVRWCEAHWQAASAWLYGVLPDQIERLWGKTKLAQQMREGALRHRYERSAGLDAALALLDPHGFGTAQPQISAATRTIDFGAMARRSMHSQHLSLVNDGRRHIDISLDLPGWVSASRASIAIPPGQQATVELNAAGDRAPARGQLRDYVSVREGPTKLFDIEVIAAISRWYILRTPKLLWVVALVSVMALFLFWRLMSAPWRSPAPPLPYPTVTPNWMRAYPAPQAYPMPAATAPTVYLGMRSPGYEPPNGVIGHSGRVTSVAFSPDGKMIASGGLDEIVMLWSIGDGSLVKVFKGHARGVSSLAFSPDGKTLAVGSLLGTIQLWDIAAGAPIWKIDGHGLSTTSIAFGPDGKTILSCGAEDNSAASDSIKLWRAADGKLLWTGKGHTGRIWSVAFSHDGETIASGGQDGTVRLWRASDSSLLNTWDENPKTPIYAVAFSPDDRWLATGSSPGAVLLRRIDGRSPFLRSYLGNAQVRSLVFSPNGKRVAAMHSNGIVMLIDTASGNPVKTLRSSSGQSEGPFSIAFSPDGQQLAATNVDESVQIWHMSTK
jgi:WD40 repeat protein/serine/threonine protein kinase